jgi:drug/metabolite transporter (DMT)-like permease
MTSTTDSRASATPLPFGLLDLALLGVAVIWGANFVVIKSAVSQFEPLAFTALRFTLATLVMAASSTPRFTLPRLSRAVWVQLGLLAIVGNVLYQPMATLGLNYTTATNAALIVSSAPAWVAVLGHVFGVDRLSARAWFGVALSAVGLGLVVAGDGTSLSLAPQNMLGNLFSLLAALGWAGSTLMMRPLVLRYSPHSVVVLSNLLAIPALLLIAVPGFRSQDWGALTPTGWLQLVFSALLAICLAYLLWAKGVQRLGAARTALYGNLVPVFAALAGVLFLGERLSAVQVVGAALVIVGIGLARQK